MIDLTPLEVRKKKGDFRRAMRGYEPAQVDDFLDIVADRLEQVVRDHGALQERVAGLERQVAENRERERALTDALVTAQTMRDEIRTKATQEVEALKQRAEQDAGSRLQEAQQQAETLLQNARQDAEAQLQRARAEAEAQLQQARESLGAQLQHATRAAEVQRQRTEEDVARLHSAAAEMRQRELELLRELRERQQKLLGSYRGFLERELHELKTMADSIAEGGDELPPLPPLPATYTAGVASAEPERAGAAAEPRGEWAAGPGPVVGGAPAAGDVPAEGTAAAISAPVTAGERELPSTSWGGPADAPPPAGTAGAGQVLSEPGDEPDVAASDATSLEAIIADATQGLATVGLDPLTGEELPPFEPEPLYDEDLGRQQEPARPEQRDEASGLEGPQAPADSDEPDEAARLLENAELAGYRIELLDDDAESGDAELLLEESEPEDRDDDWLSTMIRDDR